MFEFAYSLIICLALLHVLVYPAFLFICAFYHWEKILFTHSLLDNYACVSAF